MIFGGKDLLALGATLVALAAGSASAQTPDAPAILETAKDGKLVPAPGLLIWRGGEPPKSIRPTYASAISPKELRVRAGKAGAELVWIYDEGEFALPFASDSCGETRIDKACTVQAALHDFDGDGRPEVVVTVGNATTLSFWVLQYYRPSAPPTYRAQRDYWSILLEGQGQTEIDLDGNRLTVPMGARGKYEYVKDGGKFVKR